MTIGTESTRNKQASQDSTTLGITVSNTSTSLPNLFMILPSGVVSKNDIGAAIEFFNMPACNFLPATTLPTYSIKLAITITTPVNK